jgi:hypothetical protein
MMLGHSLGLEDLKGRRLAAAADLPPSGVTCYAVLPSRAGKLLDDRCYRTDIATYLAL